jgi:hypothetical protein
VKRRYAPTDLQVAVDNALEIANGCEPDDTIRTARVVLRSVHNMLRKDN